MFYLCPYGILTSFKGLNFKCDTLECAHRIRVLTLQCILEVLVVLMLLSNP